MPDDAIVQVQEYKRSIPESRWPLHLSFVTHKVCVSVMIIFWSLVLANQSRVLRVLTNQMRVLTHSGHWWPLVTPGLNTVSGVEYKELAQKGVFEAAIELRIFSKY